MFSGVWRFLNIRDRVVLSLSLEADQLSVKLGQIYVSLSHSLGGNVTLFTSSWLQETQIGVNLSFIKVQLNQAVQHGVIDWIHSQILMLFFQRYDP